MASQLPESALMRVSLSNDYCEIKILVDIGRSSGLNIISKHVQRLNSTLKFFTAIYIYIRYIYDLVGLLAVWGPGYMDIAYV